MLRTTLGQLQMKKMMTIANKILKKISEIEFIKKQVTLNKLSFELKTQKKNTQTLQLFAKIIKIESICKSN
jgi:hypothetical protein